MNDASSGADGDVVPQAQGNEPGPTAQKDKKEPAVQPGPAAAADPKVAEPQPVWPKVTLALLVLPILVYLVSLVGRREEEIRRFHHEMASFEKEALQSLEDGAQVAAASTMPVRSNENPSEPGSGLPLATEEVAADEKFIEIEPALFFGRSLEAYYPCSMSWRAGHGLLALEFTVDRPLDIFGASSETTAEDEAGRDHRQRFHGTIDLGKRLANLARLTGFDALLISDPENKVLLKLGPSANFFPSLSSLGSLEAPEAGDAGGSPWLTFASSSVAQVEREIAGRKYTLFSRQIVLNPGALLGTPLFCRVDNQPATGKEILYLQAVGLVESSRLTASSLRPGESVYWYFFLIYLAAFFLLLFNAFRGKPSWRARTIRFVAVLGFGIAMGIVCGLLIVLGAVANWEERELRLLADRTVHTTRNQLTAARQALNSDPISTVPSAIIDRFTHFDPLLGMTSLETGTHQKLRPLSLPIRAYQRSAQKRGLAIQTVISRADGLKTTILALAKGGSQVPAGRPLDTAAMRLFGFHEASFPKGFGASLVDAQRGKWNLLLDSESSRQVSDDYLSEFSDPDCLELKLSRKSGFCTGRLRGREARLRVQLLADVPSKVGVGQKSETDIFEYFVRQGRLALVTYYLEEESNVHLEAATLSAFRLCGTLALLVTLIFIPFAIKAPAPEADADAPPKWRILAPALGVALATFLTCAWLEDQLHFSVSAKDRSAAFEKYLGVAGDDENSRASRKASTQELIRGDSHKSGSELFDEPKATCIPGWVAAGYQAFRPGSGRQAEPAIDLSEGLRETGQSLRWAWFPESWLGGAFLQRILGFLTGGMLALALLAVFRSPAKAMKNHVFPGNLQLGIGAVLALAVLLVYHQHLGSAVLAAFAALESLNLPNLVGRLKELVTFAKPAKEGGAQ